MRDAVWANVSSTPPSNNALSWGSLPPTPTMSKNPATRQDKTQHMPTTTRMTNSLIGQKPTFLETWILTRKNFYLPSVVIDRKSDSFFYCHHICDFMISFPNNIDQFNIKIYDISSLLHCLSTQYRVQSMLSGIRNYSVILRLWFINR